MPRRRIVSALLAILANPAFSAVNVVGVEGALRTNVTDYLGNQPPCDAEARVVQRYANGLPRKLRPALEAFGYYAAQLRTQLDTSNQACWQLRVSIDKGQPVTVRNVSLTLTGPARDDPSVEALFDMFPLHAGDPLHHGDYEFFKSRVEALARERGYLEGRFAKERIDVYVQQRAADISLTYDSGPRYAFGKVGFEADGLSQRLIGSFVSFSEGQPYDGTLIADLQRDLTASGYFAEANVTAEFGRAHDRQIPISVSVTPARPTSYSVGTGFSTDDGPRFSFSYTNRLLDPEGRQLYADLLLSRVRQNATFNYRVPIANPQRDWLSWKAALAREEIDAGISAAARLGVQRTQVKQTLTVTRFVDVLLERDDVADRRFSTSMLIPGASWETVDYRGNVARPRRGHRLSLALSAGLGTNVSLLRSELRGKWIAPLPGTARVLIRGRAGIMLDDGSFTAVPLSMRFFAGGDNSIRGYAYASLGARNADGELIGGNRVIEASVEYEHPVLPSWAIATFVDSGNAFLDSDFRAETGAGIGARWFSPIGPVRLDVAWPVSGSDHSPRLHISLGPDL
jgi:translocation and assembly module TamA